MKFQAQLKAAEEYSAVFSSNNIAYVARVIHSLKQRRVNTETPECSCMTCMQLNFPCRHIIAALTGQGENPVIRDLFGDCYKVKTFQDTV